ncbi:hypothetical protein AB0M46_35110 [Dactylosporangium sp. NPDC051485]|uniref:hypothetical protein n=1 Tax=Dactylosporangium sp. NPDC051485 TaxID=3154846 RepID=UPI00342C8372
MLFTQVERGHGNVPRARRQAFLVKDNWNDFGYVTMFQLVVGDDGRRHDIGAVKIGGFGVPAGWVAWPELERRFESLDERYFSLGQDDTYYETLEQLGPDIRVEVLTALRDLAYDPALLERAESEHVTTTSLLREKSVGLVRGQFRRIANGGARVTPYDFAFGLPGWSRALDFTVDPHRQPPTNIHVLIGRNGVGKSYLLRSLVRGVADRHAESSLPVDTFNGVVAVSFSAFDEPVTIPREDQAVPYKHVGMHQPSGPPLDRDELAEVFARSLEACLTGRAAERWTRAVNALRYSGSGSWRTTPGGRRGSSTPPPSGAGRWRPSSSAA